MTNSAELTPNALWLTEMMEGQTLSSFFFLIKFLSQSTWNILLFLFTHTQAFTHAVDNVHLPSTSAEMSAGVLKGSDQVFDVAHAVRWKRKRDKLDRHQV